MSGAGYGSQGASPYGGRGGGYGTHTPSHLESTMSSASMISEDSHGYGRRGPQEAPVSENYESGYGGTPTHLQHNPMSGALPTTSKLLNEYPGRDRPGAVFASDANSGGYPAYPSLYDHADIDKLMDEYAGRTRPGPTPAYPQRYIESVEAALRVDAGGLGGPFPYQAEPQMLRDRPAMSRGCRHGESGRRQVSRLPSHAGSNERSDGNIQRQRSVAQGNSFARTRSRPSDMHPHSPRFEQQRRSQPRESIEDIMERFDLGSGRGSRRDSRSRH